MSNNKQYFKNSIFSFFSYLVISILQIIVYTISSKKLGSYTFGVWSFLYSGALVLGLSNVGIPNLLISNCSKFFGEKKYFELVKYFFNSIFIFFCTFPLILLLACSFFLIGLNSLGVKELGISTFFLFTLLFFLQNFTGLVYALIDGIQKSYVKSSIQVSSNIFFFIIVILLLKKGEINTIIICQVLFYMVQTLFGLLYIKNFITKNSLKINFMALFDFRLVKEIFMQAKNYFLISISTILFEPFSRFFIGHFCGINSISEFEIINRIVSGVRNLMVTVVQNIFPYLSYKNAKEEMNKVVLMQKATNLICSSSSIFFVLVPLLFIFFQKYFSAQLDAPNHYLIVIMCLGNFANVICSPAYFMSMAFEYTRLNLLHHFSYFVFLLIVVGLFSLLKLNELVLLAPSISLGLGSVYMIYLFKKKIFAIDTILNYASLALIFLLVLFYVFLIKYYYSKEALTALFLIVTGVSFLIVYLKINITNYKVVVNLKQ